MYDTTRSTLQGVMNYVILRPVCTAIGLITDIFGRYGKGQLDPHKSYVYLISVTNFSQVGGCAVGKLLGWLDGWAVL